VRDVTDVTDVTEPLVDSGLVEVELGGGLLRRQLTSQDWPQHFSPRGIVEAIGRVVVRDHEKLVGLYKY
jgi:hypothetical protein